ncbi:MAG TPA: hypothetical protein VKG43_13100 [Acidimicrobiales bacterium]|nr:hypothetical protein [Acidimicrobiales bacterium]
MSNLSRRAAGSVLCSALMAAALAAVAGAPAVGATGPGSVGTPRDTVVPLSPSGPSTRLQPSGSSLTTWNGSTVATQDGHTYNYAMVGEDPTVVQSNPTTTVTVPIIPLILKFKSTTFDPTVANATCGETASPLASVLASPIFATTTYTPGGTNVGTTQYEDAFQRANFWKYDNPTGINPNYHVLLTPVTEAPVTLTIKARHGKVAKGTSGCNALGEVSINYLDHYIQTKLLPSVAGVGPTTFPIVLVHNVVTTQGQCCYLGYHGAFNTAAGIQTYAEDEYDDSGDFTGVVDISTLAHEVGEWMDDPFGTNPTPAWGHVGQVATCQSNLEVGDPLTGTNVPVTIGGVTYHPQELAFFSWFYGGSPSIGVNGWYSSNHTFSAPAALCH